MFKLQVSTNVSKTTLVTFSLLSYGLLVSLPLQHLYYGTDVGGFVNLHFAEYLGITFSGLLMGQAFSPWFAGWVPVAVTELLPKAPEVKRTTYLRSAAWIIVVLSMIPSLVWTISVLNVFVDTHRGLFVEVNLLIFLMGAINSIAWRILLPRHAWFGLILTPMSQLMVLATVLTPHSWHL